MKTKYSKVKKGKYNIINEETGEKIGRVWLKPRSREWASSFNKVGIVARHANSRKQATEMGVSLYKSKQNL
jgi:hypothetical protein